MGVRRDGTLILRMLTALLLNTSYLTDMMYVLFPSPVIQVRGTQRSVTFLPPACNPPFQI